MLVLPAVINRAGFSFVQDTRIISENLKFKTACQEKNHFLFSKGIKNTAYFHVSQDQNAFHRNAAK